MVKALFDLKFPGYGLGFTGNSAKTDGKARELSSVEIPRAGKNRYLLFEERNGSYTLIDDFVAPNVPEIMRAREENGVLMYSTRNDERVLTRPVNTKSKP